MTRIQHVTVTVPEEQMLASVEAFYVLMGAVRQQRPSLLEQDTPGRWLGFEGTQVHLVLGEPVADPAHFALDAGNEYDSILARLRDAGFSPRAARMLWQARRCFVRDPAGNRVELFEHPPV